MKKKIDNNSSDLFIKEKKEVSDYKRKKSSIGVFRGIEIDKNFKAEEYNLNPTSYEEIKKSKKFASNDNEWVIDLDESQKN